MAYTIHFLVLLKTLAYTSSKKAISLWRALPKDVLKAHNCPIYINLSVITKCMHVMQIRLPITGSSLNSYAMIVELKGEMKCEMVVIACRTIEGSGFCFEKL